MVLCRTHSAVLDETGKVFVFGRTHDVEQGIRVGRRNNPILKKFFELIGTMKSIDYPIPQQVIFNSDAPVIQKVVASAGLTAMLSKDRKLYLIGGNAYGQCAVSKRDSYVWSPIAASLPDNDIEDVDLGFRHGVALTSKGSVYTWGKGGRGQLGLGSGQIEDVLEMTHVENLPGCAISVAAGFTHTSALLDTGEIFVWGKLQGTKVNRRNGNYEDSSLPRKVVFNSDVKILKMWSGQHHSVALDSNGHFWQYGMLPDTILESSLLPPVVLEQLSNTLDSVARRSSSRMISTPVKVKGLSVDPSKPVDVSVGFHHAFLCGASLKEPLRWDWTLAAVPLSVSNPELADFVQKNTILNISDGWQHTLFQVETR